MNFLRTVAWNILFVFIFLGLFFGGLEIYLRTQHEQTDRSVSAVGIPIYEADELNTYRHKAGSMAQNGYGDPIPQIRINNIGLRGTDFDSEETNKNILMIGDSFVFGTGVDQSETFSEILESNLKEGWQVWNAGHIGYSIDNYYLLLKKYARVVNPDLVIINLFVANDITELRRKTWVEEAGELGAVKDQKVFANTNNQLESLESSEPKSYALDWLTKRWKILAYKNNWIDPRADNPTLTWPVFLAENHPAWDPKLPEYWERFFQMFMAIESWSNQNRIPILWSILPMDVQVSDDYRKKYAPIYFDAEAKTADRPQTKILAFCEQQNAICIDFLPVARAHPQKEKLFFRQNADPHFDRLGHEVYAQFLLDDLKYFELDF